MCRNFRKIGNTDLISLRESKRLSDQIINYNATFNNSLAPSLNYVGSKPRVKFDGSCLKQDKITFTYRNIVHIYIAYEINLWSRAYDDYPVIKKSFLVLLG